MNFRSFPVSIIGLLVVTIGLAAVIIFHNNQIVDTLTASSLQEFNQLSTISFEAQSEEEVVKRERPEPKVNVDANTVAPQIASFSATEMFECGRSAQEKDRYQFEIVNPSISYQVQPGEEFKTSVYIKNTGTSVWCGDNTYSFDAVNSEQFKLRLGTSSPRDRFSRILKDSPYRINMDTPQGMILPGETATFTVVGIAPEASGIYSEYFQPVVEGLSWFPDVHVALDLYVGDYTEADVQKLTYLQKTGNTNEIDPSEKLTIVIDVAYNVQHEYVYLGEKLIHDYTVSSGAAATPTPLGDYVVHNKQELRIGGASPHYRMPNWIGLKRPGGRFRGYGIHALPYLGNEKGSSYFWKEAVSHLGVPVSHGCIRRGDDDAQWLWNIVDPDNTAIKVVRNFDRVAFEETLGATLKAEAEAKEQQS